MTKSAGGFLVAACGSALVASVNFAPPASAVPPDQDPKCTKIIYETDQAQHDADADSYQPIPGVSAAPPPEGPPPWAPPPSAPGFPSLAPPIPPPPQMGPPPDSLIGVPGVEVRNDDGKSYYRCDTV